MVIPSHSTFCPLIPEARIISVKGIKRPSAESELSPEKKYYTDTLVIIKRNKQTKTTWSPNHPVFQSSRLSFRTSNNLVIYPVIWTNS